MIRATSWVQPPYKCTVPPPRGWHVYKVGRDSHSWRMICGRPVPAHALDCNILSMLVKSGRPGVSLKVEELNVVTPRGCLCDVTSSRVFLQPPRLDFCRQISAHMASKRRARPFLISCLAIGRHGRRSRRVFNVPTRDPGQGAGAPVRRGRVTCLKIRLNATFIFSVHFAGHCAVHLCLCVVPRRDAHRNL